MAVLASAFLAGEGAARAAPQASLGLTIGGGAAELRGDHPHAAFHLGARGDVLFLRERSRGMALGPYADVATVAFETIEMGGGVSWLIPASESLPVVLSAGLYERHAPVFGWEPGASATVFVGARSYNFSSWYGLAFGLFLQGRYGFGDGRQADLLAGAQVDLSVFAYPFIFLYEALR